MQVIVSYDVSDDQQRARMAALLSSHGNRIQQSVFICLLDAAELDELLESASQSINLEQDTLHVFRQCSSCNDQMVLLGQASAGALDDPFWIV